MKYLLGLDYGTGGAKACIIDESVNFFLTHIENILLW